MAACGGVDRGSPESGSLKRIEGNSPRTVVCEGGDREVAHNGGLTLLSFDGGEWLLLSSSGFKKWFK
jgi:hypothetical protein